MLDAALPLPVDRHAQMLQENEYQYLLITAKYHSMTLHPRTFKGLGEFPKNIPEHKKLTRFNKFVSQATPRIQVGEQTSKPPTYRDSTCTFLRVTHPYEILVYSILEHIISTGMQTISRQFIAYIYGPLGE